MGGDEGIPVTVPAAFAFAQRFADTHLLLVGLPEALEQAVAACAKRYPDVAPDRYTILPATEVVAMDDPVEVALRRKKDSSMRVAAQAVKDGRADACISAGNTGAWMAISRYVEGNDIFKGTVDVVVCDGFVGNVALKSAEGVASMMSVIVREEFSRNFFTKLLGLIALPVLFRFRRRVDNRQYNGAALLGLRGVVIKSHGSADAFAFGCALERAREAVSTGLLKRTAEAIAQLTHLQVEVVSSTQSGDSE